jgi:tRNA pseudouridine synthase 10
MKEANKSCLPNSDSDVEILHLQNCADSVWSGMQASAETKNKSYRCMVWCESPDFDLSKLENYSPNLDEKGRACCTIAQKTPVRVLHRRSLLTRTRYIYNLLPTKVSPNCFILQLETSAGAYVKEFVHGDFGRTTPNVSQILGTKADIFQLDVVWLHDSFPGVDGDSMKVPDWMSS